MANLEVILCGIKLRNPTILASGILSHTGILLKKIAEGGAGAVTTKSITIEPKQGHKPPTIVTLEDFGMINAMGLPNPGADKFTQEIAIAKESGIPVIVSIAGKDAEEFVKVAEIIGNLGDAVELNLSCPNVEKGILFSQDEKLASEIVKKIKKIVKVPVGAKLSPAVGSIEKIATACESAGADFINAINTMPALAIDSETGKPILTNKFGGLSGPALKPIALGCVYKIYKAVKIPIIGTGGISNGIDAAEFLMAGASAVGVGTAVWKKGPEVFAKITKELNDFMDKKKFGSVSELIGIAHK